MARWPYNCAAWSRLRAAKLDEQPLCEHCLLRGKVRPAEDVDHIEPISAGGDPFPPLTGLAALCHSCHSRKTRGAVGPKVDPATGIPMEGGHWWRK